MQPNCGSQQSAACESCDTKFRVENSSHVPRTFATQFMAANKYKSEI